MEEKNITEFPGEENILSGDFSAADKNEITSDVQGEISSTENIPAKEETVKTTECSVGRFGDWFAGGEENGISDGNCGRESVLVCSELCKSYGAEVALSGISFRIPEGKIIGLLGPNGSGKTTFIKIAAGLLRQDSGEVTVCGEQIGVKTKAMVAYLPERNSIPEHFTVGEAMDFYADFFPDFEKEAAEEMLSALRVERSHKIKTLSKGTKEKVQLVMVMARRARVYLLDEPISGVDPAARDFIINTVIKRFHPSSSVIISTHLITDIEKIMDGFIFLKKGKISCIGTPEGLMSSLGVTVDAYFREVFRCWES